MKVIHTEIEGLLVLEPNIFTDERGYFFESYNNLKFINSNLHHIFVQDNESKSNFGTVRGFHYQVPPYAQAKLVRVVQGKVQDVVIDLRKDSKSYKQSYSIILSAENKKQLLIPRGFAHGFLALEDETIFAYKCDNYYNADHEAGYNVLDKNLFDGWEIGHDQMLISPKDQNLPFFEK